jgi:[acyl-carrier-protein] S-malonyltransferase
MPYALLFPGQGSQTTDMRDEVAAFAPDLLQRACELVGEDPFARVAESTRFAQPAIFCASVAGWRRLQPAVETPLAAAGHSLGELAALVAAGAIDADAALELVVLRGALMAKAAEGTMLALLGASEERAEQLAAEHGVVVANVNAPGQLVLSGGRDALERLASAAQAEGLKALELGVAGAFHSPAMQPAVAPFAAALEQVAWREPLFPVLSCATAAPLTDPARELAAALTAPVRWTQTVRALVALGADDFVEPGPGRVLTKLLRRILTEHPAHA